MLRVFSGCVSVCVLMWVGVFVYWWGVYVCLLGLWVVYWFLWGGLCCGLFALGGGDVYLFLGWGMLTCVWGGGCWLVVGVGDVGWWLGRGMLAEGGGSVWGQRVCVCYEGGGRGIWKTVGAL